MTKRLEKEFYKPLFTFSLQPKGTVEVSGSIKSVLGVNQNLVAFELSK